MFNMLLRSMIAEYVFYKQENVHIHKKIDPLCDIKISANGKKFSITKCWPTVKNKMK